MDIQPTNIPNELKDHDQWICWDTGMRDGKETKLPKDPNGGYAQTDDPSTWTSFGNVRVKRKNHDGVGFVFTEDDNLVGIDLDKCRDAETGEWEDWALEVMDEMEGFIEISPSGTGAHIILEGEIPGDRRRKGNIEIYEDGRYFTVTGNTVSPDGEPLDENEEATLNSNQEGLENVYTEYLLDGEDENDEDDDSGGNIQITPPSGERPNLAKLGYDRDVDIPFSLDPTTEVLTEYEQEVLIEAKKADNGYGFTLLWRGYWEEFFSFSDDHNKTGYSQSEADMVFCNKLAFWCSGDPVLIDRFFRASGLMREKWNEEHYSDGTTYGERTIEKAIIRVDTNYDDDRHDEVQARIDDADDITQQNQDSQDDAQAAPKKKATEDDAESDAVSTTGDGARSRSTDRDGPGTFKPNSQGGSDDESDQEATAPTPEDPRRREENPRTSRNRRARDERNPSVSDFSPTKTQPDSDRFTADPTEEPTETADTDDDPSVDEEQDDVTADDDPSSNTVTVDVSSDPEDGFNRPSESEGSMFSDKEEPSDSNTETESDETDAEDELDPEEGRAAVEALEADHVEQKKSEENNDDSDTSSETISSESEEESTDSDDVGEEDAESDDSEVEDDEDETEEIKDGSDSVSGNETIPSELGRRVEVLEQDFGKMEEELREYQTQLENEIQMQENKVSRVYRELEHYERIVDKREHQLETLQQVLFVMCKAKNHPVFDEIAEGLSDDEIPMEDILDEEFVERLEAQERVRWERQPPQDVPAHDTETSPDLVPAEPQAPAEPSDDPKETDPSRSFWSDLF
jgi:putative DNA primase/helicase